MRSAIDISIRSSQYSNVMLAIAFISLLSGVYGLPRVGVSNRIINGWPAKEHERPYQASLSMMDGENALYSCGGSIISPRWILTAAHCIDNADKWGQVVLVRVGTQTNYRGGHAFKAKKLIYHHQFLVDTQTIEYDIGLVDLGGDVIPLDNVTMKAVTLPDDGCVVKDGVEATISGWGDTSDNEIRKDDTFRALQKETLMEVDTITVNQEACQAKSRMNITKRMLCTGKGACLGDSGSPLVTGSDHLQIGIVSGPAIQNHGKACERVGQLMVYANVAAFRQWIRDHTGL